MSLQLFKIEKHSLQTLYFFHGPASAKNLINFVCVN